MVAGGRIKFVVPHKIKDLGSSEVHFRLEATDKGVSVVSKSPTVHGNPALILVLALGAGLGLLSGDVLTDGRFGDWCCFCGSIWPHRALSLKSTKRSETC